MNIDLNKFTKEELLSMLNYALDYAKEQRLEIERLNKELELYKDNQIHLNNQLEQKDNIIKEAREYITSRSRKAGVELMPREKELLEILDVEGK